MGEGPVGVHLHDQVIPFQELSRVVHLRGHVPVHLELPEAQEGALHLLVHDVADVVLLVSVRQEVAEVRVAVLEQADVAQHVVLAVVQPEQLDVPVWLVLRAAVLASTCRLGPRSRSSLPLQSLVEVFFVLLAQKRLQLSLRNEVGAVRDWAGVDVAACLVELCRNYKSVELCGEEGLSEAV